MSDEARRIRITVEGTVQGVGFRPFVYRLAQASALGGFVRNDPRGVTIEAQGVPTAIESFVEALTAQAPPHSHVARLTVTTIVARPDTRGFAVDGSVPGTATAPTIPPDLATCDDCLRELLDPSNGRYRYPFINCTACGPRFTIVRRLPYDRATTTMAQFTMCDACAAEYADPGDRRFHAEPNACPVCGPRAALRNARDAEVETNGLDAVAAAVRALNDGAIVAVKGLGGYHLACRADQADIVARLRARKHRDDKPFALMPRTLDEARALVWLGNDEAQLLTSDARPIVLAPTRHPAQIAPNVAPGRRELGVMLPYTPLHHLLVADVDAPLVMTSGNRSDEPIAYRDDDAMTRLADIADLFLTHDRPIETRCEDSVVRAVTVAGRRQPLFIRRSRGYVPSVLPLLSEPRAPVLAVGAQLKNTVCLAWQHGATIGPHVGDLGDAAAFSAFAAGIEHLGTLTGIDPEIVAHDLHPDYASTQYALDRRELTAIGVQHHHAHVAAVLAEHGERGPALGVVFDGTGFGVDGTIWGGELLLATDAEFVRVGHLLPVALPGSEAAVREPWRMACAWLTASHEDEPPLCLALRGRVDAGRWKAVSRLAKSGRSPITTSVGRLLDACAAICGVRAEVSHEAQAAIELEALACSATADPYPVVIRDVDGQIVMDLRPLVLAAERDAIAGRRPAEIAAAVHGGLIHAAYEAAGRAARRADVRTIVLSGGVFQNVLLLEGLSAALADDGYRVLAPAQLPPNDGGVSYGQAVVAAARGTMTNDVSGDSGTAC